MQPRLQKGAWSACSGLPHTGQGFGVSDALGIPTGHGEGSVGAQLNFASGLPSELVDPVRLLREKLDDRGVSRQALRTWRLERSTAQKCASFERSPILRQLHE